MTLLSINDSEINVQRCLFTLWAFHPNRYLLSEQICVFHIYLHASHTPVHLRLHLLFTRSSPGCNLRVIFDRCAFVFVLPLVSVGSQGLSGKSLPWSCSRINILHHGQPERSRRRRNSLTLSLLPFSQHVFVKMSIFKRLPSSH